MPNRAPITHSYVAPPPPPEYDLLAAGFGDGTTNGEYFEAGTVNGKPYYDAAADRTLWWLNTDSNWHVSQKIDRGTPGAYLYLRNNPGGGEPQGAYEVVTGEPPAGTFALP